MQSEHSSCTEIFYLFIYLINRHLMIFFFQDYICLHCGSYYTTAKHLKLHKEKRRHTDADESRKHKHRDGESYEFPSRLDYDRQ